MESVLANASLLSERVRYHGGDKRREAPILQRRLREGRVEESLEYWVVIIIGLLRDVAVGIQSPTASVITKRIGGTAGSFIIHLSATIFSGILMVLKDGENIRDWHKLSWYMLGAAIFGLILYQTINVTLPRMGGTMIVLIIMDQLLAGMHHRPFWFIRGCPTAIRSCPQSGCGWAADRWIFNCQVIVDG